VEQEQLEEQVDLIQVLEEMVEQDQQIVLQDHLLQEQVVAEAEDGLV
jgi:hypothetical protein